MAKAVINVICWLVCVLLMVQNRKYINPKELFRIVAFMLVGMAIGIHLYNVVNQAILVPLYGGIIVAVALKNLFMKQSNSSLPAWIAIPVLLGAGIIHGMFASGGALLVVVSLFTTPSALERVQAAWFADLFRPTTAGSPAVIRGSATADDPPRPATRSTPTCRMSGTAPITTTW